MTNVLDIFRGGREAMDFAAGKLEQVTDAGTLALHNALTIHPGPQAVNLRDLPPMGGLFVDFPPADQMQTATDQTSEQLADIIPPRPGVTAVNEVVQAPEVLLANDEIAQHEYANVISFQGGHIAVEPNVQADPALMQPPADQQGTIAA